MHLDIIRVCHHDAPMRTTLTLDDDVAGELRRLERTTRRRFKDLVNDLLRKGLASGSRPAGSPPRFTITPRKGGFKPGIDPLRLNQLADELDVEQLARQHPGGASR
jgi:hypothetical protein